MPHFGYSVWGLDKDRTAIGSGRDMRISTKHAREICNTIKGMKLERAKEYLENVALLKASVPFRRHNKKMAHRHGMGGLFKWHSGRFPEKAARMILQVVQNTESNAEYKGLDTERCRIIHAAAQKGRTIKKYIERAHGRSTPYFNILSHVEIVLLEE
ncbi:MAG TPA: 50S ribosomal protein L22 [Candidatus Lokiarchaeia archaeon]|nr:50S ribosomal protein L22 [Candidatus Lokiarchaeia archaeon]